MDGEFWDVFSASRNAMVLLSDDRRYLEANKAATDLYGISRDELRARCVDDFVPAELREDLGEQWREFLAQGHMTGRYRLCLPSGRRLSLHYSAVANVLPGCHLGIILTLLDEFSSDGAQPPEERLTAREREVVRHVARGATTAEIAAALYISRTTVDTHVRKAMTRLGARNRAHLIALAFERREIG